MPCLGRMREGRSRPAAGYDHAVGQQVHLTQRSTTQRSTMATHHHVNVGKDAQLVQGQVNFVHVRVVGGSLAGQWDSGGSQSRGLAGGTSGACGANSYTRKSR